MTEKDAWMWLLSIDSITNEKAFGAIKHYRSALKIWEDAEILESSPLFTPKNIENIRKSKKSFHISNYTDDMNRLGIRFISIFQKEFPNCLKNIPDPPLGIYICGALSEAFLAGELCRSAIALIGSRQSSLYGVEVARKLSFELSDLGYTIVSGMAKGLDAASHKGALQNNGKTIGVLGNGLDICYPLENSDLYEKIIKRGLLVSEYPLGKHPERYTFPARNRIIAGLSKGVVVIEAKERSGTKITVNHALDQGKEVFSVPGSIYSEYSKGTNELILEGATPAISAKQIDEIMNFKKAPFTIEKEKNPPPAKRKKKELRRVNNQEKINDHPKKSIKEVVRQLAPREKIVYDCIGSLGITVDKLATKTEISVKELLSMLLVLEMHGFVQKVPGQRYIRINR